MPIEEAAIKEEEAPFSFVMLESVSGYVVDPVARGLLERMSVEEVEPITGHEICGSVRWFIPVLLTCWDVNAVAEEPTAGEVFCAADEIR